MLTSNSPSNWRKETKWKLKRQKMTSNWSIIWAFSYRKMIELSWFPFGTSFENDSSFSTYWSSLVQVTVQLMLSLVPQLVQRNKVWVLHESCCVTQICELQCDIISLFGAMILARNDLWNCHNLGEEGGKSFIKCFIWCLYK